MKRFVHMAFAYMCQDCGETAVLWLEKGLEEMCNPKLKEKSGLPHKPTPFIIRCPKCGGFMRHVATPMMLSEFRAAKVGFNLFINSEKHDCGQPVFNWHGE